MPVTGVLEVSGEESKKGTCERSIGKEERKLEEEGPVHKGKNKRTSETNMGKKVDSEKCKGKAPKNKRES